MIDNNQYSTPSLSNLELPGKLESIRASKISETYINLGTLSNTYKTIEIKIPSGYERDCICQAMIWYLGSRWVAGISEKSLASKASRINKFFQFLIKTCPSSPLPNSIFTNYKHFITLESHPNSSVNTQNTLYRGVLQALECLAMEQAKERPKLPKSLLNWFEYTIYLRNSSPLGNNYKSNTTPRECLSSKHSECPYTDSQMISSLKSITSFLLVWFHEQKQRLKKIITADEELTYLTKTVLTKYPFNHPPISSGLLKTSKSSKCSTTVQDLSNRIYRQLSKKIIELNDPLLIEQWSLNLGQVNPAVSHNESFAWSSPPTLEEMTAIWGAINQIEAGEGFKTSFAGTLNGERQTIYTLRRIKYLTLRDIYSVSQIEQLMMLWLQNADCMYDSQVLTMNIDDIHLDSKSYFGLSTKNRRANTNKRVISRGGSSSSLTYCAVESYLRSLMEAQDLLPEASKKKLLPYFSFNWPNFCKTNRPSSPVGVFLYLLSDSKSYLCQMLVDELGKKRVEPFRWYLEQSILKKKPVNASAIRNSAIASRENARMNGIISRNRIYMDSELAGHNILTRLNEYMSRTKSLEISSTVKEMERTAINLMEKDARKILLRFESIKNQGITVISKEQLKDLMKENQGELLDKSHSKLYGAYGAEEAINGLFFKHGRLFFIESHLTVAFMLAQIHFKSLKVKTHADNNQHDPSVNLLAEIVVLKFVMEHFFSTSVVEEGAKFFDEFIYPTLE